MTLTECLNEAQHLLTPILGEEEARWNVRAIIEGLKGFSPTDVIINGPKEVTPWLESQIQERAQRVAAGEPVQYVMGQTSWHGLPLNVSPTVLIPRPETSQLVDLIVQDFGQTPDLRVLDLGTGSGAIAIALCRNLKFPQVTALDLSPEALKVARLNAQQAKTKINFIEADILNLSLQGQWNIIVSNPPYVLESERKVMDSRVTGHEPEMALFVPDDDPLRFYNPIINYASSHLAENGKLYLEINPPCAAQLSAEAQKLFSSVTVQRDFCGKLRFMILSK